MGPFFHFCDTVGNVTVILFIFETAGIGLNVYNG